MSKPRLVIEAEKILLYHNQRYCNAMDLHAIAAKHPDLKKYCVILIDNIMGR